MTFSERLQDRRFPVALEITPPRHSRPSVLARRAGLLGPTATAVNVIQRSGRQSSLDASLELHARGLAPVWHLVTRGRTRSEIAADLDRAAVAGLQAVLCIRGDNDRSDTPATPTIREAIESVVEALPAALTGATMNQHAPREAALRNLFPKLRAGARYVQTQPVFSLEALTTMAAAVKHASPETHIVAMAMPLLSADAFERVEARLGVQLDSSVQAHLESGGAEAGWAIFRDTVAALVASPLIDGLAIMTFETDAPPETGNRVLSALRSAGCPQA